MNSEEDLLRAKRRLEEHGVEVLGITDHHIIRSIYFFDPNGIRLELTTPMVDNSEMARHEAEAHRLLQEWLRERPPAPQTAG